MIAAFTSERVEHELETDDKGRTSSKCGISAETALTTDRTFGYNRCRLCFGDSVKRITLWHGVVDTGRSEKQLNGWAKGDKTGSGWAPSQGRML